MKHFKTIAWVSVLSLGVGGFALAQGHRAIMQHIHGDPASMVKHLAEAFPKIVPFDANKNGQLDAGEKEAVTRAIADGKLEIPSHGPVNGVKPDAEKFVNHIAKVYAFLASRDANHDGALDATEQAAIKSAIENGELGRLHEEGAHGRGEHHD
jgi:hypothetical protein